MSRAVVLLVLVAACGPPRMGEPRTVTTVTERLDLDPIDVVTIDVADGLLDVLSDPDVAGVAVRAELRTGVPPQMGRDDGAVRAMELRVEAEGAAVFVDVSMPRGWGAWWIDTTIVVPEGVDLVVDDGSGDLSIRGVASVDLVDDSGSAGLSDIAGDVVVLDDSGDLVIVGVGGDVGVRDGSGAVTIEDVAGSVAVDDDSGDLEISRVGAEVLIDDDSGSMWVSDVAGPVDITNDSGDIHVSRAGFVTVRDRSGDVVLEDVAGHEIVEDGSGSVTVR